MATPDGDGGWQFAPVGLAGGGVGYSRFARDGQGRLLAADIRESQGQHRLGVEVDGTMVLLGESPTLLTDSPHYVLAASASPTPPVGPPFAALLESADEIEVVWPLDGGEGGATQLPGVNRLEPTCETQGVLEAGTCVSPPCHEQGQGFVHATGSFTRTPDGLGWAVVVTTQLDFTCVYAKACSDENDCWCEGEIQDDITRSTLHLFRVALDGTAPVEVLTLPTAALEHYIAWNEASETLIATHAQAYAGSLAIGLRLRGSNPGEVVVRTLRVELADTATRTARRGTQAGPRGASCPRSRPR